MFSLPSAVGSLEGVVERLESHAEPSDLVQRVGPRQGAARPALVAVGMEQVQQRRHGCRAGRHGSSPRQRQSVRPPAGERRGGHCRRCRHSHRCVMQPLVLELRTACPADNRGQLPSPWICWGGCTPICPPRHRYLGGATCCCCWLGWKAAITRAHCAPCCCSQELDDQRRGPCQRCGERRGSGSLQFGVQVSAWGRTAECKCCGVERHSSAARPCAAAASSTTAAPAGLTGTFACCAGVLTMRCCHVGAPLLCRLCIPPAPAIC